MLNSFASATRSLGAGGSRHGQAVFLLVKSDAVCPLCLQNAMATQSTRMPSVQSPSPIVCVHPVRNGGRRGDLRVVKPPNGHWRAARCRAADIESSNSARTGGGGVRTQRPQRSTRSVRFFPARCRRLVVCLLGGFWSATERDNNSNRKRQLRVRARVGRPGGSGRSATPTRSAGTEY